MRSKIVILTSRQRGCRRRSGGSQNQTQNRWQAYMAATGTGTHRRHLTTACTTSFRNYGWRWGGKHGDQHLLLSFVVSALFRVVLFYPWLFVCLFVVNDQHWLKRKPLFLILNLSYYCCKHPENNRTGS
jgi:hypothetical protein